MIKLLKGTFILMPPHIARQYIDDLQKKGRNIYELKKDLEVRSSKEICILQTPDGRGRFVLPEMSIVEAIKNLNVDNEDHWNKDGTPKVEAVKQMLGRNVTKKDIEQEAANITRNNLDDAVAHLGQHDGDNIPPVAKEETGSEDPTVINSKQG